MLDPVELDKIGSTATAALNLVRSSEPDIARTSVMAGEMGPASGGGKSGVTNRFIDSFWYLEALGKQSALGIHAFARSTLTGGFCE